MVYLLKMGIFHVYVSHNPMVAYALVYYNLTSIFLQCPTLLGWNENYQISTWYGIRICCIQSTQVSSHYDIACRCFLPNKGHCEDHQKGDSGERFHEAQGPQFFQAPCWMWSKFQSHHEPYPAHPKPTFEGKISEFFLQNENARDLYCFSNYMIYQYISWYYIILHSYASRHNLQNMISYTSLQSKCGKSPVANSSNLTVVLVSLGVQDGGWCTKL